MFRDELVKVSSNISMKIRVNIDASTHKIPTSWETAAKYHSKIEATVFNYSLVHVLSPHRHQGRMTAATKNDEEEDSVNFYSGLIS